MIRKMARITSKGQVTIPRDVRRLMGLRAGDALLFEEAGNSVKVQPVRKQSPFEKYRGIGNPGMASGRSAIAAYVRQLRGR
jgi:antitoxin PrlF